MDKYLIKGGRKLNGVIEVDSSKNAVLPIISATLLTEEEIVIRNLPQIVDVFKMLDIIKSLGGKVKLEDNNRTVIIKNDCINKYRIPSSLTSEIRSSIFLLGPMLSKFKKAKLAYPGGCEIGSRPIDLHLFGLRELNVKIDEGYGYINCDGSNIRNGFIHLDFPSVGATENLMMASVLTKGETVIHNCAKEPEIVDLANFINAMGGRITGAGTSTITVEGVKELSKSVEYTPIPDRIVAGTYLIAGAITKSKIEVTNINYEHILSLVNKLKKSGCNILVNGGKITLTSEYRPKACSFDTQPYPGFPTDLQPQLTVLQAVARGTSLVTENLFETRFKHLAELIKMGADITSRDRTAIIKGVSKLYGAEISAYDLRGGAALTLAGMVAKGETILHNINYIDRGYEQFEVKLNSLGADIKRLKQ
ncbi:MAG: UDP-N-acetylglucosamine 1-carboxyvinyltransferase [Christensenellales bacterium]